MAEQTDGLDKVLRERGARYVVDGQGQAVAVLLTVDEYEHYLDLLEDEADSQDPGLAARLAQAAERSIPGERETFREYSRRRASSDAEIQG
jgi:PHD/YefM family antitoxin component YafN of YafNO toxin-antitoxin module